MDPIRFENILLSLEASSKGGIDRDKPLTGPETAQEDGHENQGNELGWTIVPSSDGSMRINFTNFTGSLKLTKSISSSIRRFSGGLGSTIYSSSFSNNSSSASGSGGSGMSGNSSISSASSVTKSAEASWLLDDCPAPSSSDYVLNKRSALAASDLSMSAKRAKQSLSTMAESMFSMDNNQDSAASLSSLSAANKILLQPYIDAEKGHRSLARFGHVLLPTKTGLFIHGGYGSNGPQGDTILVSIQCSSEDVRSLSLVSSNRSLSESQMRAFHNGHYLESRGLIVVYGGETRRRTIEKNGVLYQVALGVGYPEANNTSASRVLEHIEDSESDVYFDDVLAFEPEADFWYPQAVSGKAPTSRSAHASTILLDNLIVIYGGGKYNKYMHNIHILDTGRWHWNSPKADGKPPKCRGYHSMHAYTSKECVIFGGMDSTDCFNDVHILSCSDKGTGWMWSQPEIEEGSVIPSPRAGHASVVIGSGKYLIIRGGWNKRDSSGEDSSLASNIDNLTEIYNEINSGASNSRSNLSDFEALDDMFALCLSTWKWFKLNVSFSSPEAIILDMNSKSLDENCKSGFPSSSPFGEKAILTQIPLKNPSTGANTHESAVVFFGGVGLNLSPWNRCWAVSERHLLSLLPKQSSQSEKSSKPSWLDE